MQAEQIRAIAQQVMESCGPHEKLQDAYLRFAHRFLAALAEKEEPAPLPDLSPSQQALQEALTHLDDIDITKLNKSMDKISKRSRERAEELDLLRTQVRELRLSRDGLMEYLERECGDKCNAEYNPCNARFLLNKMMDYEVKK